MTAQLELDMPVAAEKGFPSFGSLYDPKKENSRDSEEAAARHAAYLDQVDMDALDAPRRRLADTICAQVKTVVVHKKLLRDCYESRRGDRMSLVFTQAITKKIRGYAQAQQDLADLLAQANGTLPGLFAAVGPSTYPSLNWALHQTDDLGCLTPAMILQCVDMVTEPHLLVVPSAWVRGMQRLHGRQDAPALLVLAMLLNYYGVPDTSVGQCRWNPEYLMEYQPRRVSYVGFARELGMSASGVRNATRRLQEYGLVTIERSHKRFCRRRPGDRSGFIMPAFAAIRALGAKSAGQWPLSDPLH